MGGAEGRPGPEWAPIQTYPEKGWVLEAYPRDRKGGSNESPSIPPGERSHKKELAKGTWSSTPLLMLGPR